MRRKVLFISHELLCNYMLDTPISFNTDILSKKVSNFIMSLVAERAEWVSHNGDTMFVSEGIPHDAKITAMVRSFDRHGWFFLLEAESFPDVPEGQPAPEINPIFNITRKAIP